MYYAAEFVANLIARPSSNSDIAFILFFVFTVRVYATRADNKT